MRAVSAQGWGKGREEKGREEEEDPEVKMMTQMENFWPRSLSGLRLK